MGYIKGIVHGTIIGTVVGLCVAPQEGTKTRQTLTDLLTRAQGPARKAESVARQAAPVVQSAASKAAEVAGQAKTQVENVVHRNGNSTTTTTNGGISVEGHSSIGAQTSRNAF